jgi:hypothetical protein
MEAAVHVPARPRAVTVLGWIWLVVAALQFLEGLLGIVVWKVGGLDDLPTLRIRTENLPVEIAHVGPALRYALPSLLARIVIAGLAVWAAFELLRMKPWARRTMLALSVFGILVGIGLGYFVYVSTADLASLEGVDPAEIRRVGAGAGILIALLLSSFFGVTIYTLSRPAVRGAFENAA